MNEALDPLVKSGATVPAMDELTGKVVAGYERKGTVTEFRVRDRAGNVSVPVRYEGVLPDPFRAEREPGW